jgi:uncharacterized protein (TIGR02285 family)
MHTSLLLLLLATRSEPAAEIIWLQLDWPPHQIVSGPFAGEGTYDLIAKQLIAGLPQFRHRIRLTNLQRMEQAFVQGESGVCTMVGTLYSDARAKNRLFSLAVIAGSKLVVGYINNQLTSHPVLAEQDIDIIKLAAEGALTGAYQPDRYYPQPAQIAITMQNTNLIAHNFTSEVNAVALLESGRVDYVLEYPERINYFNQLLSEPVQLEYRTIQGSTQQADSYIACSKDSIGQAAVSAINELLPQLWRDAAYHKAMRRWLDESHWQQLAPNQQPTQQSQKPVPEQH